MHWSAMTKSGFLRMVIVAIAALAGAPFLFLPRMDLPGTDVESKMFPLDEDRTRFLGDYTGFDRKSQSRHIEHEIFDEILDMIDSAESLIVADFFLMNPWTGWMSQSERKLASELAEALVERRRSDPAICIILITDPINKIYGGDAPEFFDKLAASGVNIVFTDIDRMPHSNMLYSPWAATYGRFLAKLPILSSAIDARRVSNVFEPGGSKISLRQIFRLLHFKANHRKVLVTDLPGGNLQLLATSLNPADGSAPNSNTAIVTAGPVAAAALESELQIAEWSAENPDRLMGTDHAAITDAIAYARSLLQGYPSEFDAEKGGPRVQWLTEAAIRRRILSMLNSSEAGDSIRIAMFYCSDHSVVDAIINAANRGAEVRMVLDANRDAFGREKNGVPNRVVAARILRATSTSGNVEIRWGTAQGAQMHVKTMSIANPGRSSWEILLGSANWTRRNLKNLNLESSFYIAGSADVVHDYNQFFDRMWYNDEHFEFTVPYDEKAERGISLFKKRILYGIQERLGAGTF